MEEKRKSFIFYSDWYDAICGLDDDIALEVCKAIMSIALGRKESDMSATARAMMMLIRPQIERDIEKWKDIKTKRREIGKKGGLAKASNCHQLLPNDSKSKQNIASVAVNDNVDVNVDNNSVILKEKKDTNVSTEKKSKRFVKPNVEEINAYIQQKHLHINAESFFDYYESKGWVVGRAPMKNWKAAASQWETRWKESHPEQAEQKDLFASPSNNNNPYPDGYWQ